MKRQLQFTFGKIVLFALASTVFTYAVVVVVYMNLQYKTVSPSNYYGQQIQEIENYIAQHSISLLNPAAQSELEQFLPEHIKYQVLDEQGKVLYGTIEETPNQNHKQLYIQLNTFELHQENYVKTIPLFNKESGAIAGGIVMSYQLRLSSISSPSSFWVWLLFTFALLSPFFYIIMFTLIFSRQFSKRINYPLKLLKNASEKIKNKDLDFDINYQATNELGDLCIAFSEMKEELGRSLTTQWKLEQERIEMIESLAHDLKTPISVLASYSEALLRSPTDKDEKMVRYLSVIQENVNKSALLVRQMQDSTDLERTEVPLLLVPIKIASFMKRKTEDYELYAKQKGVRLLLHIEGNTNTTSYIDEEKLERVLNNLISNSFQHTPNGGKIVIWVKIEQGKISYRIVDSGSGFSRIDLDYAFNRFYRGDPARTAKEGHSGLGLTIAKQLVEKLGGSIHISNTADGGACVEFNHVVKDIKY